MGHLQVIVSIDSQEGAERIGRALVEDRLVACFQVLGPMRSIYRWKGGIEQADEWLCLAKTTTERFDEMRERLVVLHPYDNPEIIATPIVAGHANYLDWISAETAPSVR
ncbi:Divalent-cation tolerance protein CutA [Frankia sp. AiPs1]|uniref:divalent-cation tolerance protein CutA n=1 Tax=Frankia sp. AiPa1 TaxID=573492 RepID=UPI00202B6A2E|nr:divalent-cation tolerance protein CutA [Frankia sp. AiPa1]MCL9757998.1 divalent-cation tolerance protein CutA [Frankia sp. AiPa1]